MLEKFNKNKKDKKKNNKNYSFYSSKTNIIGLENKDVEHL